MSTPKKTTQKNFKQKRIELTLSILGYRGEDDIHISHCLEMDLKGYGKNEETAFKELLDLIEMQVSFALQEDKTGLLYHPAEPYFFQIFSRLKDEKLRIFPKPITSTDYSMYEIPMPMPKNRAAFSQSSVA